MPEAVLADTKTYWRVDGTGTRKVFFIHCTLAHSGAWKGIFPYLEDACHMVSVDMPAHGRSGPRDLSVTWQTQATNMAIALLEAGNAPSDLVGHSFGATVALRIAVERPDLVRSLTLIDPVFFSAAKDAGRAEFDQHMCLHGAFYALLDKGDYRAAAKEFSLLWGAEADWDDLPSAQQDYQAERIMMIRAGGESVLGLGPDYIPLGKVAAIKVPVLLIEGEKTDPIIAAVQDEIERVLPQARRVVVPEAGHMVPITHAAAVARELRRLFGLPPSD